MKLGFGIGLFKTINLAVINFNENKIRFLRKESDMNRLVLSSELCCI